MASIFYNNVEYGAGGGHEIYYGTTIPASSLGSSGDGYCRLDANGNLIEEYIKLGSNWTLIPKSDAVIGTKTITQNGTYAAISDNLDGFSTVDVNVSGGGSTLITKTITQNGTYDAEDDNADGYSSVTVNVSGGGGGVTAKYLCRGHCDVDSGETEVNKELTVEEYTDYEDYLTYDATNKQLEVLQDFEAIIVPYIYCYQQGGSAPQMDVMINGNRYIEAMRGINTVGTTQGIAGWLGLPSEFDSIRIKLSQGDTIALQKYVDTGWTGFNIKIYKLCGVNSSIDSFMNSITTLSDTSTYTSVSLVD